MRFLQTLIFLILIGFTFSCTNPNKKLSEPSQNLKTKVDEYLLSLAQNNKFNGVAIISKNDSILYKGQMGFANRKSKKAFSDSSIFLIGSITKTFTATSILLMVDAGKISLNDQLSLFFPDFPKANQVTIKQLLTHTSGIRDYHEFKNWKKQSQFKSLTPKQVIDSILINPFRFEPNEKFSYSNSGYILLGLIIEKVSGLTFSEFITQNIAKPLQLSNTGVCINGAEPNQLVEGYRTNPKGVYNPDWINFNQPFSSGNMYSNLADLKVFTQALFKGKLISKELVELLKFDNSGSYGFGWGIRNIDSLRFYGHMGAMNGFVGAINYLPEEDLFIGYLTNDDNTPRSTVSNNLTKLAKGKIVAYEKFKTYKNLSKDSLQKYQGNYVIKEGDTLKTFLVDNNLFLQETGQQSHEMFYLKNHAFDFEILEFEVVFEELKNNRFQYLLFMRNNEELLRANLN